MSVPSRSKMKAGAFGSVGRSAMSETPLRPPYSVALNSPIAIASIASPRASTIAASSAPGTCHPHPAGQMRDREERARDEEHGHDHHLHEAHERLHLGDARRDHHPEGGDAEGQDE